MTDPTWLDQEPRPAAHVRQAAALALAGVSQPLVLAVALALLGGLVAAATALTTLSYAPTVVLSALETDGNPATMPVPRRELGEYVKEGVFTSAPLLELVRNHGLYPSLAVKNPRAALDSFREDIDVKVGHNYFAEERSHGAPPRSARIFITFHGPNPDVAVAVTRGLADLVVAHERAARTAESARALDRARREVDASGRALESRRIMIAARDGTLPQGGADALLHEIELMGLLASVPALELRRDAAQRRLAALTLGTAREARGLGLSFEIVNDGTLSMATQQRGRDRRAYHAAASLVVGLPLVAMAVGAFAPRRGVT